MYYVYGIISNILIYQQLITVIYFYFTKKSNDRFRFWKFDHNVKTINHISLSLLTNMSKALLE